jgi:hypothetical protein
MAYWQINPNDWVQLEAVINEIGARILDADVPLSTVLTSETDPVFAASDAAGITAADIANWNSAYGAIQDPVTLAVGETALALTGQELSLVQGNIAHGSLSGTHNLTTDIDHDALTNFVANEHIDWTDTASNFKTSGTVTTPSVLSAAKLKLAADGTNDVTLFEDVSLATGVASKSLYLYRYGGTYPVYIRFYCDGSGVAKVKSDGEWTLNAGTNKIVKIQEDAAGTVQIGSTWFNANVPMKIYGRITAATAQKYAQFLVDDSDDYFALSRQDTNIVGFKIAMPMLATSTIEATTGFRCGGTAAVADGTYNVDGAAAGTVSSFTTKGGIITAITTR